MSTAAPGPTPAATAAEDWLSSLDDVLGPDDGAEPVGRNSLFRWGHPDDPPESMRWDAAPGRTFLGPPIVIDLR